MAHALSTSEVREPEFLVNPCKTTTPVQRESKALRAWGLEASPVPRQADQSAPRSEVKPMGMVCEPVN